MGEKKKIINMTKSDDENQKIHKDGAKTDLTVLPSLPTTQA